MLAETERRRWALALGLLAVLGAATVAVTLVRPEVVAEHFLPDGVDPGLAWTFVAADLFAYVVFPLLAARGLWQGHQQTGRHLAVATGLALFPMLWALGDTVVDLVSDRGAVSHWGFQSTFWPFLLLSSAYSRWESSARATEDAA